MYLVGGHLVISGAITLGTMVALATYVDAHLRAAHRLTNARVDIMTAFVSFERVFEVLDTPNAIVDAPGASDLVRPRGRIELDDIWFRYPAASDVSIASLESDPTSGRPLPDTPGAFVLRGVTASIEPGQLVALVGPSGGGKTTISNLIPRLYDVTSGAVRIDGHDVRDRHAGIAARRDRRGRAGPASVPRHGAGQPAVRAARRHRSRRSTTACRAAQIHDVIAGLPDGYDTVVGERGYRLSGGEKQRVAIARVLLKDPAVVVLDEATSHLDSENEAAVQNALATALAGRTAVVIAHRLSTITNADQILVVDDGRIVERGEHHDLLEADGLYAELYRTLLRSDVEPIT